MSTSPAIRFYAVRRVNPFEGLLQVVETRAARAYSPNGRVWQIQVLAERPDHTWRSVSPIAPVAQFFNFGLWDAAGGLHKIPANPLLDIGAMSTAAEALTAELASLCERLPFPLIDRYECWLTDHSGYPLALLATTEDATRIGDLRPGNWQATRSADDTFTSPSLLARAIPACSDAGPRQHAMRLERLVHDHAQGECWFERLSDGGGIPVEVDAEAAALPADAFPATGLRSDWEDPLAHDLAHDYLAWQAPQLLQLQAIDDELRAWLEHEACKQAESLATSYRLIPHIIDHERIESARVEARLRRAAK